LTVFQAGYATALVGKWHLGFYQRDYHPQQRGFDQFYGMYTGDADHYTQVASSRVWIRGSEGLQDVSVSGVDQRNGSARLQPDSTLHSTERYTSILEGVIRSTPPSVPLFAVLAYQAVHFPMQVDTDLYTDARCQSIVEDRLIDVDVDNRKIVCGMLLGVDRSVASICDTIKDTRSWDDTLIFFISDNGGDPRWGSLNLPFRGHKDEVWEGGVRVPAFAAGGFLQRAMEAASTQPYVSEALMHVTDVPVTLMHLVGLGDDAVGLDGFDQWDAIVRDTESVRTEVVININSATFRNGGAIRVGDYKLILEWNATVHDTVSEVMSLLAESETLPSEEYIQALVQQAMGSESKKYLFNVAMNPSEVFEGGCEEKEACTSLYNDPEFEDIRVVLQERYDEVAREALDPVFKWQDDGPLASPYLFGGFWTEWRDSNDDPFAVYGLSDARESCTVFVTGCGDGDGDGDKNGDGDGDSTTNGNGVAASTSTSTDGTLSHSPNARGGMTNDISSPDYVPMSMRAFLGAIAVLAVLFAAHRAHTRSRDGERAFLKQATGNFRYEAL